MKVSDKYSVESDTLNYIVYENSTVTDIESKNYGKPVKKSVGYFNTLKGAYKFILNREVKLTKMIDLETVLKKIDDVKCFIEEEITYE